MKTPTKFSLITLATSMMIALTALAGAPGPAYNSKCQSKHYIRVDGAYSQPLEKIRSQYLKKPSAAPAYSIGAGYVVNDHVRVDLTVIYRGHYKYSAKRNGVPEKQKIDSTGVMISGYYDIKKFNGFTPYIMAGIGSMFNELRDIETPTHSYYGYWRRSFAWQVGLGSRYNFMSDWDLDIMYKYVSLGDTKDGKAGVILNTGQSFSTPSFSGSLKVHELSLGIIYKFR